MLNDGIQRRGVGDAQRSRGWLDLELKHLEHGLAVERQEDAQLTLAFVKRILTPAGKDRAVLDDRLGVVGRHDVNDDYSTLSSDVPSALLQKTKNENKNKAEKICVKSKYT